MDKSSHLPKYRHGLVPNLRPNIQQRIGITFQDWCQIRDGIFLVNCHHISSHVEVVLTISCFNLIGHLAPHLFCLLIDNLLVKQCCTSQVISWLDEGHLSKKKLTYRFFCCTNLINLHTKSSQFVSETLQNSNSTHFCATIGGPIGCHPSGDTTGDRHDPTLS